MSDQALSITELLRALPPREALDWAARSVGPRAHVLFLSHLPDVRDAAPSLLRLESFVEQALGTLG